MSQEFRTGIGFDVHAFASNRKLFIGGIEIPFDKGLQGHSDADILLHAICDAMLGALALGDIGQHFPDTDNNYKNADSKALLQNVYSLIKNKGYIVGNIDTVVAIQKPKLAPYIPEMRNVLAGILNTANDRISIKATTTEKLGFVGKEEGAAAYAVVVLVKESD